MATYETLILNECQEALMRSNARSNWPGFQPSLSGSLSEVLGTFAYSPAFLSFTEVVCSVYDELQRDPATVCSGIETFFDIS